jgi:copper homeostasis protein
MKHKLILEITVESLAAAQAAERAGADRIELCAELDCGGLTPSPTLMRKARSAVQIPVFSMIRPRRGNFRYTDEEFCAMKEAIELARERKMDGVVFGILRNDGTVDVKRTRELVERARPMSVTFHRAFDECKDLMRALEEVIETGADRVLTSGGRPDVLRGAQILQTLVRTAGERITIVPGSGITPHNFVRVQNAMDAREFHSGLGQVLPYGSGDTDFFEEQVRKLVRLKNSFGR